jgi:hypothetical protein
MLAESTIASGQTGARHTDYESEGASMTDTPIEMSDDLRAFLEERVAIKDADSPIARAFLMATLQPDEKGSVDEAHNYFDIRNAKVGARLSYTTERKLRESGNLPYAPKGHRVVAKAGAVARRVAGAGDAMGRGLDVFTNAVIARVMPPQRIEVVRGEQISQVYQGSQNCKCINTGPLRQSCMSPDDYAKRGTFKIYEDVAALAVIFCGQCGNIKARTLLWTDTKGRTWHDRVYANEVDAAMIRHWAHGHGIKSLHTSNTPADVRVNVRREGYTYVPSLDSMRYCARCHALKSRYCGGPHTSHREVFGP